MSRNQPLLTIDPVFEAVGRDPFAGKTHVGHRRVTTFAVPAAGAVQGAYTLTGFPKESLVTAVRSVVKEAFDALVTLTLGDGTDLFLSSLDIAPQTAGAVANSLTGGEALAAGKYLAAGGDLILTIGVANATTGSLLVDVEWVESDRYPAGEIK
ncbi:MAG: hypothetical protein HY784_13135 [Chloroflexi bacterium]|nr:hypothetical protein [Chloroflexota bacterium]